MSTITEIDPFSRAVVGIVRVGADLGADRGYAEAVQDVIDYLKANGHASGMEILNYLMQRIEIRMEKK